MCGVRKSVRWKDAGSQDSPSQRFSGFRDIKGRQVANDRKSLLYFRGIADCGMCQQSETTTIWKLV